MTPPVDKDICLKILDRGLRWSYRRVFFPTEKLQRKEFFRDQAKDYDQFSNPEFQEFMAQHQIDAETRIAIAEMETPGDFAVIKV